MKRALAAAIAVAVVAPAAHAAPAKSIAELRVEVDDLASALRTERAQLLRDRQIWSQEVSTLELQRVRARARVTAVRAALEADKAKAADRAAESGRDRPQLIAAAERLEGVVKAGLPFRIEERSESLRQIRRGLEAETLPADRAAARLWRFVREELRLAESTGLGRMVITVDGESILAEIVRLGMVAILFRLPDGGTGYSRHGPDGYRFLRTTTEAERLAVEAAFESLHRGKPGRLRIPAMCLSEGA